MRINKEERLAIDDLVGQIYSSVAMPLDPTDSNHLAILSDLRIKIADLKNYINEKSN